MALGILRAGTLELEGEISYLTKASVPVGKIYIQLPGKPDPSTLYYGTWENVSDEYPGDFFRVEGGNAEIFDPANLTEQADQYKAHEHKTRTIPVNAAWAAPTYGINYSYTNGASYMNKSADADTGGIETRGINRTIRIWERIS